MGWIAGRDKQDAIQGEPLRRLACDTEMGVVYGIKGPAKDGDPQTRASLRLSHPSSARRVGALQAR